MPRRAVLGTGAFVAAILHAGHGARAADYPVRPVRIIVPYTPGGTTDIATRLVAEPLSKAFGQPVVVENRPGANSIVGAAATASSAADGYTLVMVLPAHAANATLQAGKLPFDAVASFAPVSLVVTAPLVLAGSRHIPGQTLRDYLDYARRNPGKMNYGSSGIGATAHLAMELLKIRTGVQMEHIPYRGTQPALQDLMAGNIGLMFDTYSTLKPQFDAGTIRPLGIAAAERTAFAPDLPTVVEGGVDGLVASSWCMLLAPAGTPQGIVERLSGEVARIVREPGMTAKLQDLGFVVEGRPPAETGDFLKSEVERWGSVIRTAKISVE
ncbi:tripartite tricarboxylate transporter substrate binding protein [Siccirubricoccus sp. KC 17139]|uniref:Tripartite tricarboxylate transporter substrate binding protein n=1 Tax=Siccirubricoccus soli TaxID=2899147 RepID=A0ABT1DC42_9PROT|nr:tripartite tricarboxylate transporter substrate binding protein [Siccirubricoccus soli]MCO6419499.1 tripartite tricarboxylate transporter substrate binding protein [Siccirubricoccus soli]MCP2685634.1 tripartite tricarboxylate transporter substrate binding protein [Siccirubricoccus soli]